MMKRILSIFLAAALTFGLLPVPALAVETDGLCAHHTEHTAECGYREGSAGSACTHTHNDACGYKAAVAEGKCACTETDENGALVHTEGCGYTAPVAGADCTHTHGDCGYVAPVEAKPCTFVTNGCPDCKAAAPAAQEVTTYTVTVGDCANGTVAADKTTAAQGENVTLTVTPAEGFVLDTLEVKRGETALEVKENTFIMPAGDVTITAVFKTATKSAEPINPVAEKTCTCDAAEGEAHAEGCALYVAPADPVCTCGVAEGEAHTEGCDLYIAPAEPVCTCETDDPAIHATNCPAYVAPEDPQCFCVEKCGVENQNFWCDICGFDVTACQGGEEEAVPYGEVIHITRNEHGELATERNDRLVYDGITQEYILSSANTYVFPDGTYADKFFCYGGATIQAGPDALFTNRVRLGGSDPQSGNGCINGGTYTGEFIFTNGEIRNGIFQQEEGVAIPAGSKVSGGTFRKKVTSTLGTITGGTFQAVVETANCGIEGGDFQSTVVSTNDIIEGGTFHQNVTIKENTTVVNGDFYAKLIEEGEDTVVRDNGNVRFHVTYDLDGGSWKSGVNSESYAWARHGQVFHLPGAAAVEKEGMILLGWKLGADGATTTQIPANNMEARTYTAVWAEAEGRYPLFVEGIQVTDTNKTNVFGDGKVSFDPDTNTLTLKTNGSILYGENGLYHSAGIYSNGIDLTIKVNGTENAVSSASTTDPNAAAIYVENGSLTIIGGANLQAGQNIGGYGIYADGSITVDNTKLVAFGPSGALNKAPTTIFADPGVLIRAGALDGDISIVDSYNGETYAAFSRMGTITFHANGGEGTMATQTVNIALPDCGFTRTDDEFVCWNTNENGNGTSYYPGDYIDIYNNVTLYAIWSSDLMDPLLTDPLVTVNGVTLRAGEYLPSGGSVAQDTKPTGGYAYLNRDNNGKVTLTLNNATFANGGVQVAAATKESSRLTIQVEGTNSLSGAAAGLGYTKGTSTQSTHYLTIEGSGTLNATGTSAGIASRAQVTFGSGVTVNATGESCGIEGGWTLNVNGDVTATGGDYGIYLSIYTVKVQSGKLTAIATKNDKPAIYAASYDGITVYDGADVYAGSSRATAAAWNGTVSGLNRNNGLGYVQIGGEDPNAHEHSWTYSANESVITATCTAENCTVDDGTATICATDKTYDGTPTVATVDYSTNWPGDKNLEITYTQNDATLTSPPSDAGTYQASITYTENGTDYIASVEYTIEKADAEVPTGLTAYYGQTLADVALPDGWSWATLTESVGDVGSQTHKANYAGTNNYKAATNVDVSVAVSQSGVAMTASADKSEYTYGDTVTITVSGVTPTGAAPAANTFALTAPAANQVAIWNGDTQLTEPQTVTGNALTFAVTGLNAGNYTLTAKFTGNDNMAEAAANVTFAITKADPAFTAPTAKTLTYNGDWHELVNGGTATGGTMVYCLTEDGTFSETIPTGTKADDYTVWYYVDGDDNHKDSEKASVKVTIAKKPVTAIVTVQDKIYDGNKTADVSATVAGADLVSGDNITITGLSGTFSDANAGEGKTVTIDSSNVSVTGTNADCYEITYPATATGTITKAGATVTKAPEAISGLKFKEENEKEVQQSLVTAGEAAGGTMVYRISSDDEWSEDIPSAGQVRDYTVYYKVLGDSNHNDSAEGNVNVSIAKADSPIVSIPTQNHFYTIPTTGNRIDIKSLLPTLCVVIGEQSVVTGTTEAFITNAALDNGILTYDTVAASAPATGTITVKIVMQNYEDATVTVNVELIDLNPVSNSGTDAEIKYEGNTYDVAQMFTKDTNAGEASYAIIGGTGAGTLDGSELTITKAGTIQIKMTTAAQGNYAAGEATATLTVEKGTPKITVSIEGWTYGDTPNAPTSDGPGDVTYTYDNAIGALGGTEPPTDAGSWVVVATYTGNDLYKDGWEFVWFTIEQKELTPAISGSVSKSYDGTTTVPDGLSITLNGKIGNDDVSATTTYAYESADVGTTKINAAITLSGEDAKNYKLKSSAISADVGQITKADPAYEVPAGLTATYGDTLAKVTLPEGFTWEVALTTPVGNAGTNTFKVTYTPDNTDNYNVVTGIDVSVAVAKAALTITADSKVIYIGEDLPELTYTVSGLVTSDTLDTEPTLTTNADEDKAGTYTITAADADAGENYAITYVSGTLTIMDKNTEVEIKIATPALTAVPDGLKNTRFNTVEAIKQEMTSRIVAASTGFAGEDMAHYDVTLQFSLDGGTTWILATEENFPTEGITVTLPYPAGTSAEAYDFVVSHMFTVTSQRLGTTAGAVEFPKVTETASGIRVTLNGLSPVTVAWKATEFDVNIAGTTNGTVTTNVSKATSGTEVTVTVTPKTGYKMATLTVKDASGKSYAVSTDNNGKYYFTMPAADVTVTATFSKIISSTADPTNPRTGDDFQLMLWSSILCGSAICLLVAFADQKRKLIK